MDNCELVDYAIENDQNIDNPEQVIEQIVNLYRKFVSPIKQQNCPMYPSCSKYGIESLENHGLKGFLLIVDRLNRCGHDLYLYPTIINGYEVQYLDLP